MKDRQKVLSLYVEKTAYEAGAVDITELFHQHVPSEDVESMKYIMSDATEQGIYFTVVYVAKQEKSQGIVGFMGRD